MNKYIKMLLSIPKTVYVNLRLLPLRDGVKMPICVSYNTICRFEGGVKISAPIRPMMIRIGFHECDECNPRNPALLQVEGTLAFEGTAHIGRGSKIIVSKDAVLELGDHFAISDSSVISCHKHIKFGKDIQFAWDCLVMDSDTHSILDEQGRRINEDREIVFGDKVWIGNGCMVLKGASVPDHCVIGARSVISGCKFEDHTIIVGNPAKSVKKIGDFKI